MFRTNLKFLDLPSDISINIFNEWLELEDLVNLDTAYTDRENRPYLQELFRSEGCKLNGTSKSEVYLSKYLNWISLKNIKINNLTIYENQWILLNQSKYSNNVSTLQSLTVKGTKYDPNGYSREHIRYPILSLMKFSHLIKLRLENLELKPIFAPVGILCPQLREVELIQVDCSTSDMNFLFNNCRTIKRIRLEGIRDLFPLTFPSIFYDELQSIEILCPWALDDLLLFLNKCSNVRQIALSSCGDDLEITDDTIIPWLRSLSYRLSNVSLRLEQCKFTNEDLISNYIRDYGHHLISLDLQHGFNIAYQTSFQIANQCDKLTHLNLCGTNINDAGLIKILKNCSLLTSVDISNCNLLTDDSLSYFEGNNIQSINLEYNSQITDYGIANIMKNCRGLSSLNMIGTGIIDSNPSSTKQNLVSHISLLNIAMHGRNLTHLSIGLNSLTFLLSLEHVVRSCPRLTSLEIIKCPFFQTSQTLKSFMDACANQITHLSLKYLTIKEIDDLQYLSKLIKLKELYIVRMNVNKRIMVHWLSQMISLEKLTLLQFQYLSDHFDLPTIVKDLQFEFLNHTMISTKHSCEIIR